MDDLTTIARPYAAAVFSLAEQEEQLAKWSEQLGFLAAVVEDRDMQTFLSNPKITDDQMVEVMLGVAEGQLTHSGVNFVKVLGENQRMMAMVAISERFETLKARAEAKVEVDVYSAYALNAKAQKVIEDSMAKRLGSDVIVNKHIDRDLIAGVVIKAGDQVIDASVRGRLESLAQELSA